MEIGANTRSVITGAGSGFGRALALELARRGGKLVLSDINLPAAEETAQLAKGAAEVVAFKCDVTKLAQVEALAKKAGGVFDLVVNNAGVSSGGLIGELSMEDWRFTLEVDLMGVIHGCHVFTPVLRAQKHGHFLNVASAAGLACLPKMAAYNVAKAGVIALSDTLYGELTGTGVGVTVLCPTFFKTQIASSGHFTDEATRKMAEGMVNKGKTAEAVVHSAIHAVQRNHRYCLPMADARWMWRLQRLLPGIVSSVAGRLMIREHLLTMIQ